jgi:hypothetical protein
MALLEQVMQPRRSLSPKAVMKLKADVVDEMDDLFHDSLQCWCSMDKFMREQELDNGSPPSGVAIPSHFEENWGVEYDQLPTLSD